MSLSVKNFGGGGSIGSVENLLSPKLATSTKNGVTCTNNGDGTYTFNGTASAKSSFYMGYDFPVTVGQKILGCPKGGSADTYRFCVNGVGYEYGDGLIVETTRMTYAWIEIQSGYTCDNLIFKPMITTNLKATYKEFVKRVGGFTNLFNIDKATFTNYGITCTNNGDGTYTLNGTCTTETATNWMTIGTMSVESGKTYKFSGCPSGGSPSTYGTYITGVGSEHGDGRVFTATSNSIEYGIRVAPQQTLNNVVFKPMLTESLLPEYFDFVKGVEDIKPLMDILDCSGMVKGSVTQTSDLTSLSIVHNLGVVPKAIFFEIDDASVPTSNVYYTSRGGSARYVTSVNGWVVGGKGSTKDQGQTTQGGSGWSTTTVGVTAYNTSYPFRSGYTYNYIILY